VGDREGEALSQAAEDVMLKLPITREGQGSLASKPTLETRLRRGNARAGY
jgi:hypothetical protein